MNVETQKNPLITPSLLIDALACARDHRQRRWWEWEEQALELAPHYLEILDACVEYARDFIGDRWHEIEPVILKVFARQPFVDKEPVSNNYTVGIVGEYIWVYIGDVIKGRWTEWERRVLALAVTHTDLLGACVRYAKERIPERWRELEPLLLRKILEIWESFYPPLWDELNPIWSFVYEYASDVVEGPWPELESTIIDNEVVPDFGIPYAIHARRKRWHELENRMLRPDARTPLLERIDGIVWYGSELIDGAWPQAEAFFKKDCRALSPELAAHAAVQYAGQILKGQWDGGEDLVIGFPFAMLGYAKEVLKQRLPDHLHAEMVMRSFQSLGDRDIEEYFKWCDELRRGVGRGAEPYPA